MDSPNVTEPGYDSTLLAATPGSVTDSYAYSASGSYAGTITLTDANGDTVASPSTLLSPRPMSL